MEREKERKQKRGEKKRNKAQTDDGLQKCQRQLLLSNWHASHCPDLLHHPAEGTLVLYSGVSPVTLMSLFCTVHLRLRFSYSSALF